MCGILGLLCHSDCEKMKELVKKGYLKQRKQGYEGFGLLVQKRNGRIYRRRTQTSKEIFNDKIWKRVKAGDLLVFHHRNPTSTPNLPECNHPLSNENKSIYLAHIGIIANYSYHLEKNHWFESEIEEITKTRKRIYRYGCFTDSEIALHRLEEILEKKDRITAMKQLCEEFSGSVFLVVFSGEHRIYLCSNGGYNLWSYGDYIASSKLWKSARLIHYKYGYFDGEKRELVTKDIKPSFIYSFPTLGGKKEGFYEKELSEKELSEFLQKRKKYCSMTTECCEDCLMLEQCEEDFQYCYGFF